MILMFSMFRVTFPFVDLFSEHLNIKEKVDFKEKLFLEKKTGVFEKNYFWRKSGRFVKIISRRKVEFLKKLLLEKVEFFKKKFLEKKVYLFILAGFQDFVIFVKCKSSRIFHRKGT